MIFGGIDIGSRFVKIAIYKNNSFDFKIFDTVSFYKNNRADGRIIISKKLINIDGNIHWCATGYGRNNLNIDGATIISEITAHSEGAKIQTKLKDFTLVDIGGQDSKIIFIENGLVKDFHTNDRCAASTGRYLENMSVVLGMTLEELGKYWQNPVKLSTTCAIFGESELINLISQGIEIERLAAGVNHSIIDRMRNQLRKYQPNKMVLAGGVAINKAISEILTKMGYEVIVPKYPEYNGAIGCVQSITDKEIFI